MISIFGNRRQERPTLTPVTPKGSGEPGVSERAHLAPSSSAPLGAEATLEVAQRLGSAIAAIGCLTGNVSMLAASVQRRLADGSLSEEEARHLTNRLRNIHQDIETACLVTTRARADIEPPAPPHAHADGDHHQQARPPCPSR